MIKYTRKDYLDNKCTHREYYAQFVNDSVMARVGSKIGVDRILNSTDEHLNDIPVKDWDDLGGFAFRGNIMTWRPSNIEPIDITLLREAMDGVSPAGLVCIYKEAARQIRELGDAKCKTY